MSSREESPETEPKAKTRSQNLPSKADRKKVKKEEPAKESQGTPQKQGKITPQGQLIRETPSIHARMSTAKKEHPVTSEEQKLLENVKSKSHEKPKVTDTLPSHSEDEAEQQKKKQKQLKEYHDELDGRLLAEPNEFSFNTPLEMSSDKKKGRGSSERVSEREQIIELETMVSEQTKTKLFNKLGINDSNKKGRKDESEEESNESEDESRDDSAKRLGSGLKIPKVSTLREPQERKIFNLFEDWRIMETMQTYILKYGTQGLMSRSLWDTLRDPLLKRKLLDDNRSGESMRERYKRFIAPLTKDQIAEIRKFVRDRNENEEELKQYMIAFKNLEGRVKVFDHIKKFGEIKEKKAEKEKEKKEKQEKREREKEKKAKERKEKEEKSKREKVVKIALNPEWKEDSRVNKEIAEGLEKLDEKPDKKSARSSEKKSSKSKSPDDKSTEYEPARFLKHYEELKKMMQSQKEKQDFVDQMEEAQRSSKKKKQPSKAKANLTLDKRLQKLLGVAEEPEKDVRPQYIIVKTPEPQQAPHYAPKILKEVGTMTKVKMPDFKSANKAVQVNFATTTYFGHDNKKRKEPEEDTFYKQYHEFKVLRTNDYYDQRSLPVSSVFQEKKPVQAFDYDENMTVYVDAEKLMRFTIDDRSMIEEEEQPIYAEPEIDPELELQELVRFAREYNVRFDDVLNIYHRVSRNFTDLMDYLDNGNEYLLWTREEDYDLMNNNYVAIKYLRNIKGDERIERRRFYLQNY